MNKALIIAKREYRVAVRTKGFLVSILLLPVFMGGGLLVFTLLKDKVDVNDKRICVLDRSGLFVDYLKSTAEYRNSNELLNEKGEKVLPAVYFEFVDYDTVSDLNRQKLLLSDRVRRKEIHAFAEIGPDVIHPGTEQENSRIIYYGENAAIDNIRNWLNNVINNKIREIRVLDLGISPEKVKDLFYWVDAEAMGLVSVDTKTGEVVDARRSNEMQTIFVPYILLLLMFMMIMGSAVPLLNAVMEEKSERIAEVLLGTVTPWQFMTGKILGSLAVSLTTSAIYIAGAVITMRQMDLTHLIPYNVLPWFFVYMILNIIMVGSIMASLGAICNDSKDAQAIQFPAMLPIIIPLFLMMPVILNPLGKMATGLSLVPLWTPMLMLLRQSTSVTIPFWQPVVGLIGVILFTILCVWAGARIFRSAIILVGKRPKFVTLLRYIIKG
ncbi:MAG: ABC transporter permease [Bacteroidales bacterium]|nr:ABC transporter permease [Bacteroidales bacterium]